MIFHAVAYFYFGRPSQEHSPTLRGTPRGGTRLSQSLVLVLVAEPVIEMTVLAGKPASCKGAGSDHTDLWSSGHQFLG